MLGMISIDEQSNRNTSALNAEIKKINRRKTRRKA